MDLANKSKLFSFFRSGVEDGKFVGEKRKRPSSWLLKRARIIFRYEISCRSMRYNEHDIV
jgi:hypothetical protein